MGLTGLSMTRSPWMAPPPPSHEEERAADTMRAEQFSERTNSQVSGSDGALLEGTPGRNNAAADSQPKLPFPDIARDASLAVTPPMQGVPPTLAPATPGRLRIGMVIELDYKWPWEKHQPLLDEETNVQTAETISER